MTFHEVSLCLIVAFASSYLFFLGFYPQALFAGFVFLVLLAVIVIHAINSFAANPLPRVSIPVELANGDSSEDAN